VRKENPEYMLSCLYFLPEFIQREKGLSAKRRYFIVPLPQFAHGDVGKRATPCIRNADFGLTVPAKPTRRKTVKALKTHKSRCLHEPYCSSQNTAADLRAFTTQIRVEIDIRSWGRETHLAS